jgi:hypothetical protein
MFVVVARRKLHENLHSCSILMVGEIKLSKGKELKISVLVSKMLLQINLGLEGVKINFFQIFRKFEMSSAAPSVVIGGLFQYTVLVCRIF